MDALDIGPREVARLIAVATASPSNIGLITKKIEATACADQPDVFRGIRSITTLLKALMTLSKKVSNPEATKLRAAIEEFLRLENRIRRATAERIPLRWSNQEHGVGFASTIQTGERYIAEFSSSHPGWPSIENGFDTTADHAGTPCTCIEMELRCLTCRVWFKAISGHKCPICLGDRIERQLLTDLHRHCEGKPFCVAVEKGNIVVQPRRRLNAFTFESHFFGWACEAHCDQLLNRPDPPKWSAQKQRVVLFYRAYENLLSELGKKEARKHVSFDDQRDRPDEPDDYEDQLIAKIDRDRNS